jgi:hypothetical protein
MFCWVDVWDAVPNVGNGPQIGKGEIARPSGLTEGSWIFSSSLSYLLFGLALIGFVQLVY